MFSSMVRAVSRLAMISQSAKIALPAMWSVCQWLSTSRMVLTPRPSRWVRIARAWSSVAWLS